MGEAVFPPYYLPGPNYGGGNEDTGDLPQKIPCMYCYSPCPQPCIRPPVTHAFTGDSWTPTGKSGTVSCGVTAFFSWVLVHKVLLCPPRVYFPVLCKFWQLYGGVNGDLQQEDLCHKSSVDLWTQWTWVWVNSGSWWWTGRPGVLQFMGSQRVRHDWLNWTESLPETPSETNPDLVIYQLSRQPLSPGKWHTELSIPVFLLRQDPMLCHP